MSDKLQILKSQAKVSMQSLVDRALVQDEVSRYKRFAFKRSYRLIGMSMAIPMVAIFLAKVWEHGEFHRHFTIGASNFFLLHGSSMRELYAPEIYAKDKKLRPYEANQFS